MDSPNEAVFDALSRLDARVEGNGAIDDLGVIAYAGVPLVDEGEHTLGALCVVDGQPREWTQREVRTLETLAKTVMAEVHLRQTILQRQQEALERTRQVMDAAGAGLWNLDATTRVLEKGLAIIHPEDRSRVAAAVADATAGRHECFYEADYRTVPRLDGSYRWVAARGQAFFTPEGKAWRFLGTGMDITERKAPEEVLVRQARHHALSAQVGLALTHRPASTSSRSAAPNVEHHGTAQVDGDADRLGQVVQNLVTNALKYSPEDTRVRGVTRGEEQDVSLSVFNGGAPIPEDKLASIFEPMQRATAEVDQTGRSVGLGLYIVKSIVAAHGGRITVTSTRAEGTRFTVRLPRQSAGAGPRHP